MHLSFSSKFLLPFMACIFLFLGFSIYNHTDTSSDLAEYINNALRTKNGYLPYRDFWLLFPPAEVFLPASLYMIFGLNINIVLSMSPVINSLTGIMAFLVGRKLYNDSIFALIVSVLVFFILFFKGKVPSPHLFFILASTLFFLNYLVHKQSKFLVLAGLSLGLSYLFRFYLTGAANAALLLTVIINEILYSKHDISCVVKKCALILIGPILILGLTSLALKDIWISMANAVVFESVAHGTSMNLAYFSSLNPLKPYSIKYLLALIYYLLPAITLPFCLLALTNKNYEKTEKVTIIFFLLWALFTMPKVLGRSDIPHLSEVLPALFFLVVLFLHKEKKIFLYFLFLPLTVVLALQIPISFYDIIKSIQTSRYEVSTKYGKILMDDRADAETTKKVIQYINANTKRNDYIFVTSFYSPAFYALTNRKNPTYYDSLIDLVSRPSEKKQLEVCEDIITTDTKLVVHNPNWGFDKNKDLNFATACRSLQKCIEENFKNTTRIGPYLIYEKL